MRSGLSHNVGLRCCLHTTQIDARSNNVQMHVGRGRFSPKICCKGEVYSTFASGR